MSLSVRLYTLSTCVHCKKAKQLMNDCAVVYECKEVDLLTGEEQQAILEEVRRINPDCTFPTIIIGDKVIVGFSEHEIRGALGLS